MATNAFSMDSAAGHFVSGCEGKYITALQVGTPYISSIVFLFCFYICVAMKCMLYKFHRFPRNDMEAIAKKKKIQSFCSGRSFAIHSLDQFDVD